MFRKFLSSVPLFQKVISKIFLIGNLVGAGNGGRGMDSAESIEWFIDAQDFLRSYDSAPPSPPPSPVGKLSFSQSSCVSLV